MLKEKEFVLSDRNFNYIRELVGERTGIVLSDLKRDMTYGRLVRRLRELRLSGFDEYCELLKENNEDELINLTNAITTNLTSFFREPHHFEFLSTELLSQLLARKKDRRLRIWSAGCSSGEEPYTIAMTILESVPAAQDWDIRILATDLDYNMVNRAATGIYTEERVNGIDARRLKRWFRCGRGENVGMVKVSPELQQLITFKQLNLLHQWPMKGPFDIIFCRNVVIYFNKDTQRELFSRYADIMTTDGHLFIGHSESLYKVSDRFELLGRTIYRRKGE